MNMWHSIPPGDDPPVLLNAVIEVVTGSRDKYEYCSPWEAFVLDRIIPSTVVFPVEYGFVPQTWYDDNDPVDIMVLSYEPLTVGCVAKVRLIGALIIDDEEGNDAKLLSVLVNDARFEGVLDIGDVHAHRRREIQEFFEVYKRLEPQRWARTKEWLNAAEAQQVALYAMAQYAQRQAPQPAKP